MGKKKKPFIERKGAVSFRLLHRSQKDPLIADAEAGERVLHPMVEGTELEERHKYGIYYRDDYDYLKHLKEVGEAIELVGDEPVLEQELVRADNPANAFPSCIFETRGVELKVGMLNQAAPTNELLPNIDPDVAAALEGEVDEDDGELEDDFMLKANAEGDDGGSSWTEQMRDEAAGRDSILKRFGLLRNAKEKFSDESSGDEDSEEDDEGSDFSSDLEQKRTKFTNYSMSSAVIKRPDGLRQIDDHFENLYAEQYAGEENEEAAGNEGQNTVIEADSERFIAMVEEQSEQRKRYPMELPNAELKESVLRYVEAKETQEGQEKTERILVPADGAKRGRWDCESIISTYSTLYNHPTAIREQTSLTGRRKRKGITKGDLNELDKMQIDDETSHHQHNVAMSTRTRTSMASSFRPKGETAEERRVRKQAVKEERRERRKEKKANREAFREKRLEMEADRLRGQGQKGIRPIH